MKAVFPELVGLVLVIVLALMCVVESNHQETVKRLDAIEGKL
jgi:hypothetical protein